MELALRYVYLHTINVLMLLAGTVNDETPASTKLHILSKIMEYLEYLDGNYTEELKRNLDGLPVSEVFVFINFLFLRNLFHSSNEAPTS